MSQPILLGVNIDHVATLRQARGTNYPCPVKAALLVEQAGGDFITAHLREDRRHIQDKDIIQLQQQCQTHLNFEMAVTSEMIELAKKLKPKKVCLVPEKREELTTEGGLDVVGQFDRVQQACQVLSAEGIEVSLFIGPDAVQIQAAKESGAPVIELHTGEYAENSAVLGQLQQAAELAHELGLGVNAGHGLTCANVQAVAAIPSIKELNIGHAIVADALFLGLEAAVREFKRLMLEARA